MDTGVEKNEFKCSVEDCRSNAQIFCVKCAALFCDKHNQVHHSLLPPHNTISIETYNKDEGKYGQTMCTWHNDQPLIAICSRCQTVFCAQCLVDKVGGCAVVDNGEDISDDAHEIVTINSEAGRIRLMLIDLQSMLHVTIHKMNEALKKLHMKTDSIQEKSRDMLDEIDRTVQKMKMKLDSLAEELRDEVISHMNFTRLQIGDVETNVQDFSNRAEQLVQRTSVLLERDQVAVISNYKPQETEYHELIRVRFPTAAFVNKMLVIPEQDINFLALVEKPSVPMAIRYRDTINVSDECYTLTYLPNGSLVHAGKYPLSGIDTSGLSDELPDRIDHMYSYFERLYMISIGENRDSYLHMLNLSDNILKTKILSAPADQHFRRIAATDHHILITEYGREVIHVYSSGNFEHQFDMKVKFHPSSIVPLPTGDLVLADSARRTVVCITLHMESEEVWEVVTPTAPGIAVLDKEENYIYVSSCAKPELYMISLEGELIETLRIPELNGRVHDFSISDQGVALFGPQNFSPNIKLYDLEFHQPM